MSQSVDTELGPLAQSPDPISFLLKSSQYAEFAGTTSKKLTEGTDGPGTLYL